MSMAEVIESIEKDMWRDLESRSVPESHQEMIDCTTFGDKPEHFIVEDPNGLKIEISI